VSEDTFLGRGSLWEEIVRQAKARCVSGRRVVGEKDRVVGEKDIAQRK
jgi:hypothetical protein